MTILSGSRDAIYPGMVEDGIRPFIVRPGYRPDPDRTDYKALLRRHWPIPTLIVIAVASWGFAFHALPVVH